MNARTLVITAGAIVALAAPAVATAKLSAAEPWQKQLDAKKHAAKHGVNVFKRQGQSRRIYTYVPAPVYAEKTLAELQAEYNADVIGWSLLDPANFANTDTSSDTSTSATSDSSPSTTSDSAAPSDTSFAAAPAPDASGPIDSSTVDNSDDC